MTRAALTHYGLVVCHTQHVNKRQIWKWLIGGFALLMFISVVWPFIARSKRPSRLSFKIQRVYTQTAKVDDTFTISAMTKNFVVAEGPCGGNDCNGGILSEQYTADYVKDVIPDLKGFDNETTTIIWLYQIKPVEVTRHNDLFGDDTVTITGKLTKEQKIYFALVPKQIVEPHLQCVFVETQ
ncbi:MAG: hypothetical protein ABI210_08830 [Abditibacteriaceae bacterium]